MLLFGFYDPVFFATETERRLNSAKVKTKHPLELLRAKQTMSTDKQLH